MDINQLQAIKNRDRLKWDQANHHLVFKNLRNGILKLSSTATDIAALLDDSQPQPWRIRTARGALPRVVPGTGLSGATRTAFDAAAATNPSLRPPFFLFDNRVGLSADQQALATTWVNMTARQLSRIIADFGLAKAIPQGDRVRQNERGAPEFLSDLRWRAKPSQFLPEQFSQDWDYVDRNPLADNIDTYGPVAGHFGPPSNIYHIGLVSIVPQVALKALTNGSNTGKIMWSCITGLFPRLPTTPVQTPMELADGDPWWTWAGDELLDDDTFGEVDREIRELVMRCLVEEPGRRIEADILLAYCQDIMAELSQVDGSRDDDLSRWVATYFAEPPLVNDRPPFDTTNLSNDQILPSQ
ncbi:hypothetical protein N0V93_008150 [Gnomoniopsis smithogilvyi]|uniref:Protein kinase domain-containing protein n=1 Tax=Gnomoniopsis smithogilvyi TaxID=1191159 RepID=A0A9W9CTF4_9PEZI|nr:hypothetical protein N0V93_008150 [Gnomoniopsis smithogilvyi]